VLPADTYEIAQRLRMSASADDTRLGYNRISVLRDQFNLLMDRLADPRYLTPHLFCKYCGITRVGFQWFSATGAPVNGPRGVECQELRGLYREAHEFIPAEPRHPAAMPSSWTPV